MALLEVRRIATRVERKMVGPYVVSFEVDLADLGQVRL